MAPEVKGVRIASRTDTAVELEIQLENSEVVKLRLNSMSSAAIIHAILENGPYERPSHAGATARVLDVPSYGFATSPSAEGHVALAFQLTKNCYPLAIRVPHAKLPELRAAIAQWETQRAGKA